jgi:hypothetical protein
MRKEYVKNTKHTKVKHPIKTILESKHILEINKNILLIMVVSMQIGDTGNAIM